MSSIVCLHSRLDTTPLSPRRDNSGATRVAPRDGCSGPREGLILKLASRWSPPVRFRYTRNSGRAQQRNISAATGSAMVSRGTLPAATHRNASSRRLARHGVKPVLQHFQLGLTFVKKSPNFEKISTTPCPHLGSALVTCRFSLPRNAGASAESRRWPRLLPWRGTIKPCGPISGTRRSIRGRCFLLRAIGRPGHPGIAGRGHVNGDAQVPAPPVKFGRD